MQDHKVLRSRILEYFPKELRVEIELLSLQRRPAKEGEIDELLRKYEIPGITKLGSGTNRYAIKIGGYVIKFATDHDGKIDNLKEFKMAPKLYPYVATTYEVSSSGTMLVAEYIQPFMSYAEMVSHGDEIRAILRKLSSRYLIGDIGITSVNYTNWGLRVGSEEPVCLDFAYVYDVTSNLFVCRNCHTNTMLVPDENFVALVCPACKKTTTFSTIRGLIGNDLHDHEIGDLSEEGYVLSEPSADITLDPSKSTYLKKTKEEKEMKISKDVAQQMARTANKNPVLPEDWQIPTKVVSRPAGVAKRGATPVAKPTVVEVADIDPELWDDDDLYEDDEEDEDDDDPAGVAFEGTFTESIIDAIEPSLDAARTTINDAKDSVKDYVSDTIEYVKDRIPVTVSTIATVVDDAKDKVTDVVDTVAEKTADTVAKVTEKATETVEKLKPDTKPRLKGPDEPFDRLFTSRAQRAVSKFANKIGEFWNDVVYYSPNGEISDIWAQMQDHVNKTDWSRKVSNKEELLDVTQRALFRSLMDFCGFTEVKGSNPRTWTFDADKVTAENNQTVRFIEQYWIERTINSLEKDELIQKFQELGLGFQYSMRDLFKEHLKRNGIDDEGADKLCRWYLDPLIIDGPDPDAVTAVPEEDSPTISEPGFTEDTHTISSLTDIAPVAYDGEPEPVITDTATNPDVEDLYDDDDGEDDEDEDFSSIISVTHDGSEVKFLILTSDTENGISIPIYMDEQHLPKKLPAPIADDRNGVWEWLVHLTPDRISTRLDPDGEFKSGIKSQLGQNRYSIEVILDENDGKIIVGEYDMTFSNDQDVYDDNFFFTVCAVVCNEIGCTGVSALGRSLRIFLAGDWDDGEGDEIVPDIEDDTNDDDSAAAVAAEYMGGFVDDDDDEIVTFQPIRRRRHNEE